MLLILVENIVRVYLCGVKESALHQFVLNIIEKRLLLNKLTLHQLTESKQYITSHHLLHLFHQRVYH